MLFSQRNGVRVFFWLMVGRVGKQNVGSMVVSSFMLDLANLKRGFSNALRIMFIGYKNTSSMFYGWDIGIVILMPGLDQIEDLIDSLHR